MCRRPIVAGPRRRAARTRAPAGEGADEDGLIWLEVAAAGSPLRIAPAARSRVRGAEGPVPEGPAPP